MARRDRVPLNTPIVLPTVKGWRIDPRLLVDIAAGTIAGSISFYDTTGKWLYSRPFTEVGAGGGDLQLTVANLDAIANLVVARLQLRDATLAGTRITDTVTTPDDTVINP